jgi:hypothetical protein
MAREQLTQPERQYRSALEAALVLPEASPERRTAFARVSQLAEEAAASAAPGSSAAMLKTSAVKAALDAGNAERAILLGEQWLRAGLNCGASEMCIERHVEDARKLLGTGGTAA